MRLGGQGIDTHWEAAIEMAPGWQMMRQMEPEQMLPLIWHFQFYRPEALKSDS